MISHLASSTQPRRPQGQHWEALPPSEGGRALSQASQSQVRALLIALIVLTRKKMLHPPLLHNLLATLHLPLPLPSLPLKLPRPTHLLPSQSPYSPCTTSWHLLFVRVWFILSSNLRLGNWSRKRRRGRGKSWGRSGSRYLSIKWSPTERNPRYRNLSSYPYSPSLFIVSIFPHFLSVIFSSSPITYCTVLLTYIPSSHTSYSARTCMSP